MGKKITVVLAGNPNSGKSTIFNNLTGARQHVGNYPGVTVEKKEGLCKYGDVEINLVDLPGTYSLTAYSIEEVVARNFIIDERPDVVVDIVDASNLERNMYLTTQFIELGIPLVLAFNMSDQAKKRGIEFDLKRLSELLGAPIVPTVGHKGRGMSELLDAIVSVATGKSLFKDTSINYGREIEEEINKVQRLLDRDGTVSKKYDSRWLAIKLLEEDTDIKEKIRSEQILAAVEKSIRHLGDIFGEHPEIVISERRYGFVSGVCQESVIRTVEVRHTISDRIDVVITNRVLGIPIFLVMMYLVFHLTFTLGDPPMRWIEFFFRWLGDQITAWWPTGSESALKSLLVDGIVGGVGGVIAFLPNIMLLFLAIAVLEDTGYMARAAFIMDHLMHKIGLHGSSFIPMLIGFGCSVPAIMATRTLENPRDRLTTILVIPLMSCGARLPIYALIIPAFFPQAWQAPILWTIYMIGIVLAVLLARFLRSTILRGEIEPFVMELPPYRIPTLKGVIIHMWERAWLYLKKAGTIILGISVLLWVITSYPKKERFDKEYNLQVARAEQAYLRGIKGLSQRLGIPKDSEELIEAIGLEKSRAKGNEYYRRERGLIKLKKGRNSPVLARFLEIRDRVEEIRARFDNAVAEGEFKKGSLEYMSMKKERDFALAELERVDPIIYAAVVKYLDEIRAPFEETLNTIYQEKRAEELAYSVAGRIGHALEPLLRLMGFDWKIGTALIGAFAAKEVFVAQMGIIYSVGSANEKSESLRTRLRREYPPLVGFCIMLFCLISMPCVATIAVTRLESNSWKWALLQLGGLTTIAYMVTVFAYQVGSLIGLGVG
nr:ferrous iron transport protein B [Desulfobacterales bacterium]